MTDIYDILSRLGVVRKYLGRDYLAYSIRITLQNENYFFLVTKCLYPDVASHFNTNGLMECLLERRTFIFVWREISFVFIM